MAKADKLVKRMRKLAASARGQMVWDAAFAQAHVIATFAPLATEELRITGVDTMATRAADRALVAWARTAARGHHLEIR